MLQLKSLGIDNILAFEFLSPPPAEMMIRALEVKINRIKRKCVGIILPYSFEHKSLRIDNILAFEFLSPPPAAMMIRAIEVKINRIKRKCGIILPAMMIRAIEVKTHRNNHFTTLSHP